MNRCLDYQEAKDNNEHEVVEKSVNVRIRSTEILSDGVCVISPSYLG